MDDSGPAIPTCFKQGLQGDFALSVNRIPEICHHPVKRMFQ